MLLFLFKNHCERVTQFELAILKKKHHETIKPESYQMAKIFFFLLPLLFHATGHVVRHENT